jgi:hypothetical protein
VLLPQTGRPPFLSASPAVAGQYLGCRTVNDEQGVACGERQR